MAKCEDLTGKQFGYWTVVERAENHPSTRSAQWLCECECGTRKVIRASELRTGRSKSCGCHKMIITKHMVVKELVCMKFGVICDTGVKILKIRRMKSMVQEELQCVRNGMTLQNSESGR